MTGNYPVVWGSDFVFSFGERGPETVRQEMVETAIMKHEKGHIITLMWHACPPNTGMECEDCTEADLHECDFDSIWVWNDVIPQSEWYALTTPGTELHANWTRQVDRIAEYLKQLQDAKVPVLWRPYHEMNGMWFWWCQKPGEYGYERLWKQMYDRLVNHHQLNNLLWVWNPNAPRETPGDQAFPYHHYYPGDEYVDILAADVYHRDYRKSHEDQLLKLAKGKPIAFGEVGALPAPEVVHEQPQWTWFMEWSNWLVKANKPEQVKALYDDPKVVTLDEIERDENGKWKVVENRQ